MNKTKTANFNAYSITFSHAEDNGSYTATITNKDTGCQESLQVWSGPDFDGFATEAEALQGFHWILRQALLGMLDLTDYAYTASEVPIYRLNYVAPDWRQGWNACREVRNKMLRIFGSDNAIIKACNDLDRLAAEEGG